MKIRWLGHASFLITSAAGIRIITDPYSPGGDLDYGEIQETADIVTVSHDHFDHSNVDVIGGNPRVVRDVMPLEFKGIGIRGVPTHHDDTGGDQRGNNIIFCLDIDDISVCHLGDLGHLLTAEQLTEVGAVDVLLIPVGGFFTIDARVASEVCEQLAPGVVIPMHYKNERCRFPITGVEEFLKDKTGISRRAGSEVELKREALPAPTQIIVLKPAL